MKHRRVDKLLFLLLLVLALFFIRLYAFEPALVLGRSMEPTLRENNLVFVNKLAYRFSSPRRGDVVMFRTSNEPPLFFVKRVVGLPGETVEMREGLLFVNGAAVEEPYAARNFGWNIEPLIVEERCVLVMGDNRAIPIRNQLIAEVALRNVSGPLIGVR